MNYDRTNGEFLTPGLTASRQPLEPLRRGISDGMIMLGVILVAPVCLILVVALTSAWGGSVPRTTAGVHRCLADHGATNLYTGFTQHGTDAESNAIGNFLTGYRGTVSGIFHGNDFQADVYDDVYLTSARGSAGDFQPLGACFDVYGPYRFSP